MPVIADLHILSNANTRVFGFNSGPVYGSSEVIVAHFFL